VAPRSGHWTKHQIPNECSLPQPVSVSRPSGRVVPSCNDGNRLICARVNGRIGHLQRLCSVRPVSGMKPAPVLSHTSNPLRHRGRVWAIDASDRIVRAVKLSSAEQGGVQLLSCKAFDQHSVTSEVGWAERLSHAVQVT